MMGLAKLRLARLARLVMPRSNQRAKALKRVKQAKKAERKRNKNEKKRNDMLGFGRGTTWGKAAETPTTSTDNDTLSVALFKQSTLNEIGRLCLPTAGDSEFQVHYRAMQVIISRDDSDTRVVITIPTVFFNMPQKVGRASVVFNLDEIAAISNSVAPISEAQMLKYTEAFPSQFFKDLGYKVIAREAEIGSIHRHPFNGGFSGIDYDNKAENPGVIFRTLGAVDKVQVDSVMYIPQQQVSLVVTETRVINVQPTEIQPGITGEYLRTPTLSYIIEDVVQRDKFGSFFGREQELDAPEVSFIKDSDNVEDEYPEVETILGQFINNLQQDGGYEPMLIIDPALITQEYSYGAGVNTYNANRNVNHHTMGANQTRTNSYLDGEYPYLDEEDGFSLPDTTTATQDLPRPQWQKVKTIAALKKAGIDVNHARFISGSGTPADIKAANRALIALGLSQSEALTTLLDASYTAAMITNADIMDTMDDGGDYQEFAY